MGLLFDQQEKKKIMNELNQESVKKMKELSSDDLHKVVGAGDPYSTGKGNTGNSQRTGGTKGNDGPIVLPELP